jgi:hypothetical protein
MRSATGGNEGEKRTAGRDIELWERIENSGNFKRRVKKIEQGKEERRMEKRTAGKERE